MELNLNSATSLISYFQECWRAEGLLGKQNTQYALSSFPYEEREVRVFVCFLSRILTF